VLASSELARVALLTTSGWYSGGGQREESLYDPVSEDQVRPLCSRLLCGRGGAAVEVRM
jgi:hypothetical protein